MGQTLTIKCPECGNQFKWKSGPGFIVVDDREGGLGVSGIQERAVGPRY